MRIHLDTDLGGDADDLAALAMLLGDPDVEITGITVSTDTTGHRTAYTRHVLELAGRADIQVAGGAAGLLGIPPVELGAHDHRYFPDFDFDAPILRDPPGAALDLLARSVGAGATVIAIGPFTNLAALEAMRPGTLRAAPVAVMGGYVGSPRPGYPQWPPNMDFNVQCDRVAARTVFEQLDPLITPLLVCMDVALETLDIAPLEAGGPLSRLVALQGQLQFADSGFESLVAANPALPRDLLNFQWDPLACGAALGWDCITVSEVPLELVDRNGALSFEERPGAPARRVVTAVDAPAFRERWLERVVRV